MSTLGVGVAQYGPFAFFNLLMPVVVIVMAYLGYTVADSNGVRLASKKNDKAGKRQN